MENLGVTEVTVLVLGVMGLTLGAFGFKAFIDVHQVKKELQRLNDELNKKEKEPLPVKDYEDNEINEQD